MLIAVLLLIVVSAILVYLLVRFNKERREQDELVQRVCSSRIFRQLRPLLQRCTDEVIDEMEIHPNHVRVLLLGSGSELHRFEDFGVDPLQPKTVLALSQAIAMSLPALQDNRYYRFQPHTSRNDMGEKQTSYCYYLRHDRKDYELRIRSRDVRDR